MRKVFSFINYKYLPILLAYIGLILIFGANELVSDRLRYWIFSENLSNGYYFDPEFALWNGPGYPLYIAFLRIFGLGWKFIVFTNAILLFLTVIIFERIVSKFIKNPFFIVYLFAFWEPVLLYQYLPHMMTEVFVIFLISLFVFLQLSEIKHRNIFLGAVLSLIILTKAIFFYVTVTLIIITFLLKKFREKRYYKALILSIIFCTPYLIYSYSLSNKYFYFSNAGGSSFYWMSEPNPIFRGDWNGAPGYNQKNENISSEAYNDYLNKFSWPIDKNFDDLNWIEKDEVLKKKAINNILNNKLKYFKNWINNLGRLFFGYPFTFHTPNWQHILITFKQSFLITALFFILLISILRYKEIQAKYLFLICFFSVYIFGVSLLSAYPRFLFITNIITWVYGIYVYKNFLKINLK